MPENPYAPLSQVCWIEYLPKRNYSTPGWVLDQVQDRMRELRSLPPPMRSRLSGTQGVILDVGPGEGVSSMALAQFAPEAAVLGIEMDQRHLGLAWPACLQHPNLRLAWGSLPGTPSNPRVAAGDQAPPVVELPLRFCDVLFCRLGLSRTDMFESTASWAYAVNRAAVLIYPRFWRVGLGAFSDDERGMLRDYCDRHELKLPDWTTTDTLPGFDAVQIRTHAYDVRQPPPERAVRREPITVNADGWLLWLSGLFDDTQISFVDVLHDRSRWDLNLALQLEVMVASRPPRGRRPQELGGPRPDPATDYF